MSTDRLLLIGAALSCGVFPAACDNSPLSCVETATCPPTPRPDSGSDVSAEAGEDAGEIDVATPEMDASTEVAVPPVDVKVEPIFDAPVHEDALTDSPADTHIDVPGITDVAGDPDACDPGTSKSPVESTCLISEKYGIFVSPLGSDTTGAGTRDAPYKTIARALQSAKGNVMRVYACDEGTGYPDALTIDATLDGTSLYGGFECTGWTYATTRRARVHPATGVALIVKGLTAGVTVEDFEFNAADAAVGASSIGAIVDTALNVVMRGVRVSAGKGGGGVDGADGAKGVDAPDAGNLQQGGPAMCPPPTSQQNGGNWSGATNCASQGGNGGHSSQGNDGTPGLPGNPRTGVTPPDVNNRGAEGPVGQDGSAGSPGNGGVTGVASTTAGTFNVLGYTVAAGGGPGSSGNVGQGGGGGGASNAPPLSSCIGASGGAGGMGGCGGSFGTGGASAGASVALLIWTSTITLDRCELTSSTGGSGGNGGKGGKGGAGKAGGNGGAAYAGDAGPAPDAGVGLGKGGNGGPGGNGGNGGSGAGGNGGPSYAIVYKGTPATRVNGTSLTHGTGGTKGKGGSIDDVAAPDGLAGTAGEEFSVP